MNVSQPGYQQNIQDPNQPHGIQQLQIGINSNLVNSQTLYNNLYQQQQGQQPQQKSQSYYNPISQNVQNPTNIQNTQNVQQVRHPQQPLPKQNEVVIQMPAPLPQELLTSQYWTQQTQLAIASRKASLPHTYARTAALASRASQNPQLPPSQLPPIQLNVCEQAMQFVSQNIQASKIAAVSSSPSSHNSATPGTPNKSRAFLAASASGLHHMNQRKELMEDERQRKINEEINKQFWTSLDLSGQGLPALSPKVCNYDFLQRLYLCHNKLETIPASIVKLTQLKVLDISSNMLKELPEELGLLYHLRYLFFFDNNISSLPQKFGGLFQLDFMGIEGNPLDEETRVLMAKEGTRAVIQNLRDKAPRDIPLSKRDWIVLDSNKAQHIGPLPNSDHDTLLDGLQHSLNENVDGMADNENKTKFTALSYNVLCETYATPSLYAYVPSWALDWSYRSQLLLKELIMYNTDICCLQEVSRANYESFFKENMKERGYNTQFLQKGRFKLSDNDGDKIDGCASFYRTDKFKLIERHDVEFSKVARDHSEFLKGEDTYNRFLNRDNVAMILVLEHIPSGRLMIMVNTHLHWDPAYKDVKVMQVVILLEELAKLVKRYTSNSTKEGKQYPKLTDIKHVPVVICGDFNSTQDSGVYHLLTQGKITKHIDLEGRSYGKYSSEGISHDFPFKSAYSEIGELPFTNFTPNFVEAIEYFFYTSSTLDVTGLLGPMDPDYPKHNIAIPDAAHPSDHIPIMTEFQFKKLKEKITGPPANFSSMSRKT